MTRSSLGAPRLDLDFEHVRSIRRACIEQLACHTDGLIRQFGELAAHLDELLRAEGLVIKHSHRIQNALSLRGGVRLGLRFLLSEDVAALFELAAERNLLLGEDVMLALLAECARA